MEVGQVLEPSQAGIGEGLVEERVKEDYHFGDVSGGGGGNATQGSTEGWVLFQRIRRIPASSTHSTLSTLDTYHSRRTVLRELKRGVFFGGVIARARQDEPEQDKTKKQVYGYGGVFGVARHHSYTLTPYALLTRIVATGHGLLLFFCAAYHSKRTQLSLVAFLASPSRVGYRYDVVVYGHSG
ncbi:hypothetical protein B0F90DRAFT_1668648 [Multifurca ochricompacta]|uniref:Uncharacterized protein n=1 Tax=Multifurca ochricompacta TaxID=376703 RepID=A0AAD4M2D7_9AGAM|nr:hypothetical protein B0F90DRAFT_1668648 [Multifurca ochricompacta]